MQAIHMPWRQLKYSGGEKSVAPVQTMHDPYVGFKAFPMAVIQKGFLGQQPGKYKAFI